MNLLIETLNAWADHAFQFAWPMLWQSSLLIGCLFALDLLLRRKLRPAVRYALWLVVLVKLLLPPSFAFPTSPGWWLRPVKTAPARPRLTSVMVTYAVSDGPALPVAATPVFVVPSRPRLTPAAWAFVGMITVGLGLLAWMLARWHQVARDTRRAAAAPAWLGELLPELRRPVRLRLTDHPQSPAVCGLFRPVILLPRSLAEHLPPAQLRAVLLHELLHLRRGDVWVNCAQALLQIAYWWHPLLWLANARIRRVREEAVDDAVMLALNEDAETYAPTLLEVAKLALHRPLATLGLVGILESRSSLRQRIERLMDFRPPRRAGLTLASVLTVLAFAALAVPMGEAPAPTEVHQMAGSPAVTNSLPPDAPSITRSLDQKIKASTLTQDGKLLYEMGKLNEAEAKLEAAVREDPQHQAAAYYLNLVREARLKGTGDRRKVLTTPELYAQTNLIRTSDMRRVILATLDSIRMDRVSFDGLPLSEVVRSLADETRKRDPEKLGVNFIIRPAESTNLPWEGALDRLTGLPKPATPATAVDLSSLAITIKPPLTNLRLLDVLEAIVKVAGQPIKYSIETDAVVFSARTSQESPPLYIRTFKVDPNAILDGLHVAKDHVRTNGPGAIAPALSLGGLNVIRGPVGTNWPGPIVSALRGFLASAGVDLDPVRNPGKALFYNDRRGMIVVRATMQDLDIIEQKLSVMNTAPPQINIKCKFVEISQDDTKPLGFDWYLGNVSMTNGASGGQTFPGNPPGPGPTTIKPSSTNQLVGSGLRNPSLSPVTLTGILTDPQFRMVIKALQQRSGAELIAQPEVTTTSGRQAQMKASDIVTVVKGINERALTPPGITTTNGDASSLYVTEQMELGPVLDVIPSVLSDGCTIGLTLIPTLNEFLGYEEDRTNRVAVYANGKKKWGVPPRPKFRVQQMYASVNVLDGQTVVLGSPLSETVTTIKDSVPLLGDLPLVGGLFRNQSKTISKKNLLVFVTPTLIDPVGNRIHPEGELLLAPNGKPPQAPH
jgi:beta-lactamase regulating signal transducer with metallopeptidase domain